MKMALGIVELIQPILRKGDDIDIYDYDGEIGIRITLKKSKDGEK